MRFRGRAPDAVRPWVPLGPGERVLAHGRTTGGWAAIATTHALQLQTEHGEGRATPYVDILSARWVPETATLELVEMTANGAWRWGLAFDEPGRLPETVRERVQQSIVASRRVQVRGSRGATVVARRAPGGDEPWIWQISYDSGVDRTDDAFAARVNEAMAELRAELGV